MQDVWAVFNSLPQWFHFILLILVLSVVYLAGVVLLIKKRLDEDDYYYGGAMHAPAKAPRTDVDDLAEAAPSLPYAARPNFHPVNRPVYFKAMVLRAAHRLEAEGRKVTVRNVYAVLKGRVTWSGVVTSLRELLNDGRVPWDHRQHLPPEDNDGYW